MRLNLRFLVILSAIGLLSLFGWNVRGQQTSAPKAVWEHAVVSFFPGDNSARLTQLGAEGWELVAVSSEEKFSGNFRQMEVTYYLKRAKSTGK
jgi:hypothetical protein